MELYCTFESICLVCLHLDYITLEMRCLALPEIRNDRYIILAFAGVVNVILNLFFVIVCHLGVAGVALASMISQFISAFLILRALLTGKEKYCLRLSEIRFDKRKAVGILQIGIPSAFQYSLFAFANLFVQSSVNSFDHVLVEGNSAAANADPLVYDMMAAFYTACSSFIAQNLVHGKRNVFCKPI